MHTTHCMHLYARVVYAVFLLFITFRFIEFLFFIKNTRVIM